MLTTMPPSRESATSAGRILFLYLVIVPRNASIRVCLSCGLHARFRERITIREIVQVHHRDVIHLRQFFSESCRHIPKSLLIRSPSPRPYERIGPTRTPKSAARGMEDDFRKQRNQASSVKLVPFFGNLTCGGSCPTMRRPLFIP